ncbi:MAG: GDP-mannose 4,6-dehydratase [Promethearchaeota archaeon]
MIRDKSILITGGAGFIGSHLFEELIVQDNDITIIDNFNDFYKGKEDNIKEVISKNRISKNYEIIRKDLLDKDTFSLIKSKDFDYIFHLAAQASVRYSIQNSVKVTDNNVVSTVKILEHAKETNVKKVIYASSSSVYGNPIKVPVSEDHPKNPISPYALTKLCGELYCDYYFREFGIPTTSLRFYTVYGPRGRPDMAIRKFFNLILEGKEIIIYGDGKQIRDFTYISDIINGLILAAEKNVAKGEVFNLGCSDPIKINDLVDKMFKIANKPKKVKYTKKQKGDVDITHSDITKAKKLLGYVPKINIDEGLRKTFKWQAEHFNK